MKIIHVADVHWRGLSRHDEYRRAFSNFFKQAIELKPDVIYIGGDIVHSKTQGISPELIDSLTWWFTEMAKIAPTHVILGNHDGLILNKQRQDAISPILTALNNPRIHLYKKSGRYSIGVPGFNWCVFSCFDEDAWEDVKPAQDEINIALFHGGVLGSVTDSNWDIEGDANVEFFNDYDFTLLGDIHKCQFMNDKKTVAYSGSTIQQNYGEDPDKGFLFWDIRSKDDFDVKFYPVEHDMPFVTIDWTGTVESTLNEAQDQPQGARFRVRSNTMLQQADMKLLGARLKANKQASEIVYKVDQQVDASIIRTENASLEKKSLRDSTLQKELMRTYHQNAGLTNSEWSKFDDLVIKVVNQACQRDDSVRGSRWSIKKIEFDNTFGYGKENVIDFDKLGGITGIFGKNRSGKSSIIGTLMYVFYNTTDRGPIKNLHIVNTRKSHCKVNAYFSVNGSFYRVERFTIKSQSRAGKVSASTGLNLFKTDAEGNDLEDLSGEQRRETEKVLRKLIGSSNDFLLTSLAPQGDMNTFIKERATSRKMILSKFLDLDIFDKMYDFAKDESSPIRAIAKSAPEVDYVIEIKRTRETLRRKKKKVSDIDKQISVKRTLLQDFKIQLATSPDFDAVSIDDIKEQKSLVDKIQQELKEANESRQSCLSEITDLNLKIKKTEQIMKNFPIEEINQKISESFEVERNLIDLKHQHNVQKQALNRQEKSIAILEQVPCGDSFPTCKFIKNSHKNKDKIGEQRSLVDTLHGQVKITRKADNALKKEDWEGQKKKYEALFKKINEIKIEVSKKKITSHDLSLKASNIENNHVSEKGKLSQMEVNLVDENENSTTVKLKKKIRELSDEIKNLDDSRLSLAEQIGHNEVNLSTLKLEKQKYAEIKDELKLYDMLQQGVSKKGIPRQIIASQLPLINMEISKILQGITGFTVELESDPDTNAMDIYINYGDSKRIIELGSGMEKMMASLAIRVALINISSLPKTDMLIIDEGFGALDETNIEACNNLLTSLKKWFRNIIIISHVDAVKDAVDNVIDISSNGNNSSVRYD